MQKKTMRLAFAPITATILLAAAGSAMAAERVNERRLSVRGAEITLWNTDARDGSGVSYTIDLPNGGKTTVENAQYTLGLAAVQGDPLLRDAAGPGALMTGGSGVYIVQFHTQPLEQYTKEIEAAGGTIYQYMAQYAYAVKLDEAGAAAVSALPFVRWVGEYQPLYKIEGDILLRDYGIDVGDGFRGHMQGFNTARGSGVNASPVAVMLFEGSREAMASVVANIGAIGGGVNGAPVDGRHLEAVLTGAQIAELARNPLVQWIEPTGPWGTDMDNGRVVMGANYIAGQTAPPNPATGYNGEGVRGEICDTETLVTHQDFQVNPIIVAIAGNSGLHGSACSGINFGTGAGNFAAKGFMPAGQGIFANSSSLLGAGGLTNRMNHTIALQAAPYFAVFQTNSTGDPQITTYSSISAGMDNILFQNEVLHLQSQSNTNNQNSRPQAWSKNMVSVGGLNHFNNTNPADDSWSGASIGYGSDGRAKPDIANWYDQTLTTWGSGVTSYTNFSGTSNATPMSAGASGLFHQMWHQGIFGNTVGASVFASRPKISLAKAILINTANQWQFTTWTTGQAEPNRSRRKQGYGHPNVQNMYDLRNNMFWVNEADVLQNLQSKTYSVRVVNGSTTPFKATMVYQDPQGNPATQGQHRINNLNLKVTDPNGVVYWGNWGLANQLAANGGINNWANGAAAPSEGMWSVAGGAADQKNTVENVFVQTPAPGVWTIEITAAELVQDAFPRPTPSGAVDATFSFVVTGAVRASCPGDTNGDNIVNFADLNACLSNFGAVGATLAMGDVDGDGDVDFGDLNIILSNFGFVC